MLIAPALALLLIGLVLPFAVGEPMSADTSLNTGSDVEDFGSLDNANDSSQGGAQAPTTTSATAADRGAANAGDQTASTAPDGSQSAPTASTAPQTATTGGGDAPGATLTASDVGVTPGEIQVAVFVPNLGGFAGAGFAVDLGDSRASFEAFFRELNEAGGIHGRQIKAHYIDFDPLSDSSMRSACLRATEDLKVFATFNINGFYGPGILCVTEEHQTPLMEAYYSEPEQWYQRSNGLYITAYPSKSRALRNLVAELDAAGVLEGKTIGVVDTDYPFDKLASETALLPALSERGYEVAHRATLSSDTATSQSQIPLEIQRMQAAGVDTIFFAAYFVYVTTWVQQSANRGYYPQYTQSDFANGTSDGGTSQMPESYDGTIGVTSTRGGEKYLGRELAPVAQRCLDRWKQLTGTPLEPGSADETIMLGSCGSVDTFAAAAGAAGPELTRPGLVNGYASLGEIRFPNLAPFTWAPGKLDGGDQVRFVQWHYRFNGEVCRCWVPVDDFRPAKG